MTSLVEPSATASASSRRPRPPAGAVLLQIGIIALIVALFAGLAYVTNANLRARGVATGFDFLWRPSGIPIANTSIPFTAGVDSYGRAVLVGLVNTLKISAIAILGATILGTLIGIARLSSNWLLSHCCLVYVDIARNVPLLLQLLFWYQIFHHLPGPRQALSPMAGVYLSNRGLRFPAFDLGPSAGAIIAAIAAGIVLAYLAARLLRRSPDRRLRRGALPAAVLAALLPPAATAFLLGATVAIESPRISGLDFRGGGTLSVELTALVLGLTLYAAAFVSEIVRSGILAVPKGQWEAAASLGLPRSLALRKVVIPQTMRIVVPPMTGEYLGIIKNSSLAIAVGYQDLVAVVNGMLSDTGQAIEGILIIVAVYLAISLAVSFAMSRYEAATSFKER